MRLFSFMFIIIVLALNFVPCDDSHELSDDHASISSTDNHSPNENAATDACTPFCHCACCAASLISKVSNDIKSPLPIHYNADHHFLVVGYSNISHTIWQPPKLV
jgi:hypothetical protein